MSTGGPAFPTGIITNENGLIIGGSNGMTLRDYFAAQAMSSRGFTVRPYDTTDDIAKDCYRMADAMLKAREQ